MKSRAGNEGGEAVFEGWGTRPRPMNKCRRNITRSDFISLFLSPPHPLPSYHRRRLPPPLVYGDLVRGRRVVLSEGWALVALGGLGGGATYWGVGGVGLAGRGAVHVLRGEQGHVRAHQVLLDSAHCEPGLQGAAWRKEVVSLWGVEIN